MSIKINQPITYQLTIYSTVAIASPTSYYMTYLSPTGSTGVWSTVSFTTISSTASLLTYEIQKNILNENGTWRVTGWIELSTSLEYPSATDTITIIGEFD